MQKLIKQLLILTLLLIITQSLSQNPSHRSLLTQSQTSQYKDHQFQLQCKQIGHTDDDYLCVDKVYEWVLKYIDVEYDIYTGKVQIQFQARKEVRERILVVKAEMFFIRARVEHQNVTMEYLSITEDTPNKIAFKTVPIPESLKKYEQNLPKLLYKQIEKQFAHKRANLLLQAAILIIVLLIFIGVAYTWRKTVLSLKIDRQAANLREAMLAKLGVQEEENRKPSAGVVRVSQPPLKILTSGIGF